MINWKIGETSGSAELDEDGIAHVYLAPMYEDFFFISFRMGSWDEDTSLRENILTRRLVIFGNDSEAELRISDIICPSPDPKHKVFIGWQEYGKDAGDYYSTVDENGVEIQPPYYITIHKTLGQTSYNLYPVFSDARWLNYTTGIAGSGATYVPSQFLITNDTNAGTSIGSMPTSIRNGYSFDGWYVNAVMDEDGEIRNKTQNATVEIILEDMSVENWTYYPAIKITNSAGQFLDSVTGKVFYSRRSEEQAKISRIYMGNSVPTGSDYQKLFEITSDKKLLVYAEMEDLNLIAEWIPDSNTTYKVIV